MIKPNIYTNDLGDINIEFFKKGSRFILFFGSDGMCRKEDCGWVYVDKNGEMRSGELPKEIHDAFELFINYKE